MRKRVDMGIVENGWRVVGVSKHAVLGLALLHMQDMWKDDHLRFIAKEVTQSHQESLKC